MGWNLVQGQAEIEKDWGHLARGRDGAGVEIVLINRSVNIDTEWRD